MHYWNRDNFESLAALATELASDPRLVELARYCELREQGLRDRAFAALELFISSALSSHVDTQRELALRVLAAHAATPHAHQFMTHPLQSGFLGPVLERWAATEPRAAAPAAALGLLRDDARLLGRALELDPSNDRVRARLVSQLLRYVDHATHHLVESKLIGTTEEALTALDDAERHIRAAATPARMQELAHEVSVYRSLLHDWSEYLREPAGTFPEWCAQRGRPYRWPSIVYYDR